LETNELQNCKLLKFSFDLQKVKKMVSYIIEMPREEDGHSRAHKFPFVASEVFNSEADVIFKYFFPEEPKPVMQI